MKDHSGNIVDEVKITHGGYSSDTGYRLSTWRTGYTLSYGPRYPMSFTQNQETHTVDVWLLGSSGTAYLRNFNMILHVIDGYSITETS
jgi:hypothetical protein